MLQTFLRKGRYINIGGKINMINGHSKVEINNCGTPACIGGWLAVYYNTKKDKYGERNFTNGVKFLLKKLGFGDFEDLSNWQKTIKMLWGELDL